MRFSYVRLTVVALALGGILSLSGCKGNGSGEGSAASPLAGTWTRNFNGSTVTIVLKDNGSYTVNMGTGAGADVRGRYTVENDQMTFVDEGGTNASVAGQAVYRFALTDDQLTLTPIDEPDENRESVAAATWTKS